MKLIELGTGPQVQDLLVDKLQAVLDGKNPDTVPEDPSVGSICLTQKHIHWEQLMFGRFAKEWDLHNRTQPGTTKTHRSWTTEIIDFIFTQWWTLWESRNQDRHGRDMATSQQAEARQVNRELTMFYEDYEHQAPQLLQWVFHTPIALRRQWSTYATRQWLNTWKPILLGAVTPEAAPTNPENYPYTTALETG